MRAEVVTQHGASTVGDVTNPNETSWEDLTRSMSTTATPAEALARRRRVWQDYHQADSVGDWLTDELQSYLGQDADVAEIVDDIVETGMTFLDVDDVVSTAVMLVTPPQPRVAADVHFAAITAGLVSPVALITLAADQCAPGDLVIVRTCLAAGATYRRQLVFPFSMDEAVAATAPPTLTQAMAQQDVDEHEDTKMSRRLRALAWLASGAGIASAAFWLLG